MILEDGPLFIADTQCHPDPTPQQVMETVIGAARHVRRFGLTPKIALCSHSQFGNTRQLFRPQDARRAGAAGRTRARLHV